MLGSNGKRDVRGAGARPAAGRPAGADEPREELVWLVGGSAQPFEEADPSPRPWLEESVEWNTPRKPEPTREKEPPKHDGLIWL